MTNSKLLVSELDMLKLLAAPFTGAASTIGFIKGLEVATKVRDGMLGLADVPLSQDLAESLKKPLENLRLTLEAMELPVTLAATERLQTKIAEGGVGHQELFNLCDSIQYRLQDELGSRFLLSLSRKEANEFSSDGFGAEVHAKFPSIIFELDEASKCMAFGRYTAAVFHWMRAVEAALRAVRLCLGATAPPSGMGKSWGTILAELRNMRTGSPPRWPENDYFSSIYASFEAVMHAWRNGTMHIENKYTREEAESIRDCVKALLQRVASRMDEQGIALA